MVGCLHFDHHKLTRRLQMPAPRFAFLLGWALLLTGLVGVVRGSSDSSSRQARRAH